MKKLTLALFTLLLAQGCQTNTPSAVLVNNDQTFAASTTPSPKPVYATRQIRPDKDDLLHIQRLHNNYCKPEVNSYLPDLTFIVTQSGILRHGEGNSITIESSGGLEFMKSIQLSEDEFSYLKQRIRALREILRSNPSLDFTIKSPKLNPPDYVNGECAIFESFSFADEKGVHEVFDRPDFELYEAPESIYPPAYIAAMDDLKKELYALRYKYSDKEGL